MLIAEEVQNRKMEKENAVFGLLNEWLIQNNSSLNEMMDKAYPTRENDFMIISEYIEDIDIAKIRERQKKCIKIVCHSIFSSSYLLCFNYVCY